MTGWDWLFANELRVRRRRTRALRQFIRGCLPRFDWSR